MARIPETVPSPPPIYPALYYNSIPIPTDSPKCITKMPDDSMQFVYTTTMVSERAVYF